MVCSKCGAMVDGRSKNCSFCGTPTHNDGKAETIKQPKKENLFNKYKYVFLAILIVLIILIVVLATIFSEPKNERRDALLNIKNT